MKFFTSDSSSMGHKNCLNTTWLLILITILTTQSLVAQNVFSGEPVQWVGRPNGFSTVPYNADYRTTAYRTVSVASGNPTDGRGQWSTTINVQNSGGDILPDNMPGGAGAGWLLISGPSGNRFQNKWNFTGVGQGALNSVNDVTLESGGEDMGLDMGTTGYYTFNMKDAGYVNTQFYVGYTTNAPVTVTRSGETLNGVTNGTTISITTSDAPSTGENIYIRYTTGSNDFTAGTTVIQAFGSGTSWSAEIPAQACGTDVYYYVYSSTRDITQVATDSESDRSLSAIRYDDNAGANYTYQANTALVQASAGANGTISPGGTTTHTCGDDVTYTFTPNECYTVQDVLIDGVSQGPIVSYTFTGITGEHSVIASFALSVFTINASAGNGGSISPDGASSVNCADAISYSITADPCFSISSVLVDGISVGAVSSYTFNNVNANHTIVASFSPIPYNIFVTQGNNGNIAPGTRTVNCGSDATYTITANPCYVIEDVIADGVSVGAVSSYTFTNVQTTHSITATFAVKTFTITASAGANGSVTPSGASIVNCGTSNLYNIVPDVCYHVEDVLVDGVSQGAITSYTFSNTNANHSISASFALNTTLAAPVISGPVNVCQYIGTAVPVTYTAVSQGAASYNWVLPPNVVAIASTQNSITVTFNVNFAGQANRQIRVNALSPCGNSATSIYYLQVQTPGTPAAITGNNNICGIIGTANTFTYTIPAVPGATSYNWTSLSSLTFIDHINGPGENDTSITVRFATGYTNSSITVQAVNSCGVSGIRSISLVVTPPSTPSPISGPTNICANIAPGGTAATYSVTPVGGVTYNWTLPPGATSITGQGTATISFIFPTGYTGGSISVVASKRCGVSAPRSLNVSRLLPSAPSGITAVEIQGCPDRIVRYSVTAIPSNATSVVWTVPTSIGGVLLSGQGTTSIEVSYPAAAATGAVTATGTSNCGNSSVRSLTIRLTDCGIGPPPPPGPKAGKGEPAISAAETMKVDLFPNPTVSDAKLRVVTAGKEKVNVRIMDMQGRSLKQLVVMPYQTITIGSDLQAGSYIVEVRQGAQVKTTKLMKF